MRSLSSLILLLITFLSAMVLHSQAKAETQYGLLFPPPDETILDLLTREDIANADRWWMQFGIGGTIYEARQGEFMPRWSPGLQFGRRYGRFGVFGQLAFDESFDFTQEIKTLNVYHVGIGIERLALYGRIRASATVGAAILGTQTDFDEVGTIGWFIDLRPISLRWTPFGQHVMELTPLSVAVSVPVARGIPLILFSYFTVLSIEFAAGT